MRDLCSGLLALALASAPPALAAPDGAALFTRCAACHLPTGEGVPGSFPAFRGQIVRFARKPAGREYMVTVVTHGLAGALSANGASFDSFMPAQVLTDDQAAAVLTYVANNIAGAKPSVRPFTPAEVAADRARHQAASAQASRALRPDALAGK